MAKIKDLLLAELDQLEIEKGRLAQDRGNLEVEKSKVEIERKELEALKNISEKSVVEAGGVVEVEKMKKELADKIQTADKALVELKLKRIELIKWENRLYDIETRQKNEHDDLMKRAEELDLEKRTYKETLKTEFLEELKRQLPR